MKSFSSSSQLTNPAGYLITGMAYVLMSWILLLPLTTDLALQEPVLVFDCVWLTITVSTGIWHMWYTQALVVLSAPIFCLLVGSPLQFRLPSLSLPPYNHNLSGWMTSQCLRHRSLSGGSMPCSLFTQTLSMYKRWLIVTPFLNQYPYPLFNITVSVQAYAEQQ